MELRTELLQKTILLSIVLSMVGTGMEFLPIFPNYDVLTEQLHQGFLHSFVNSEIHIVIYISVIVVHFAGLFLLYKTKSVGRPVYLISYVAIIILIMLDGDLIQRSLVYPIEVVASFLEVFILYLIYFTPLKKEFSSH